MNKLTDYLDLTGNEDRFPPDDPNGHLFEYLFRCLTDKGIRIDLNDIGDFYHRYSMFKGFYNKGVMSIPGVLGHIASEVSEAWQRWYNLDSDEIACARDPDFAKELADIIIMTCLLAQQHGIDISQAVRDKTIKNASRGIRHGKK